MSRDDAILILKLRFWGHPIWIVFYIMAHENFEQFDHVVKYLTDHPCKFTRDEDNVNHIANQMYLKHLNPEYGIVQIEYNIDLSIHNFLNINGYLVHRHIVSNRNDLRDEATRRIAANRDDIGHAAVTAQTG